MDPTLENLKKIRGETPFETVKKQAEFIKRFPAKWFIEFPAINRRRLSLGLQNLINKEMIDSIGFMVFSMILKKANDATYSFEDDHVVYFFNCGSGTSKIIVREMHKAGYIENDKYDG